MNLHPIMFLLNLIFPSLSALVTSFTSHYVPIKSRIVSQNVERTSLFTSHYVPIKSDARNELKQKLDRFTSHYVPIKSANRYRQEKYNKNLHPIMFLLNPIPI